MTPLFYEIYIFFFTPLTSYRVLTRRCLYGKMKEMASGSSLFGSSPVQSVISFKQPERAVSIICSGLTRKKNYLKKSQLKTAFDFLTTNEGK